MSSRSSSPDQFSAEDKAREVQRLFKEIQALAAVKDFTGAEELRDKLIEFDPMALRQIIDSADIIEKEKAAGIDRGHLALWNSLYQTLNEEEKNCLYYSMSKLVVPPKRKILTQGTFNDRLFLIESGDVVIYKPKGDKNVVVAKLGSGDLLGEYTFTTISLCSASVINQTEVQMRCLESSATDDWEEKQPGLFHKLVKFCQKNGHLNDIARIRKQEKWKFPRHAVQGRVTANLLAKDGTVSDAHFNGSIADISRDGTCFEINCSKKKTARALLARDLVLSFSVNQGEKRLKFSAVGTVVRVSFHLHNDYSIHMRFKNLLQEELITKLAAEDS